MVLPLADSSGTTLEMEVKNDSGPKSCQREGSSPEALQDDRAFGEKYKED